jgi:PAS domain S-box-containing protein
VQSFGQTIVQRSGPQITRDKLQEEWSLRLEERARPFLDANPDLMFLMRRDGTYLDFRPAKDVPTYVEPTAFLGRQVRDVLPENVAGPSQHFIDQAIVTRQTQCFEYELPLMGRLRTCEARIVANGPDQVLVVVRDVTERSRADVALRERETHFRAIFEHASDAIGVAYWGNLVFVNPAHAKLFAYESPAELVGRSALDLIAPDSRSIVETFLRRRAAGKPAPTLYRTRGLRKDGSVFEMEARASEYQQDGKIYSVVILREIRPPSNADAGEAPRFIASARSSRSGNVAVDAAQTPQRRLETGNGSVLTFREVQVLTLVAQGKSTKELAAILGISVKTAESHRTHVMEKLRVHETASVVRFAIRAGLVEP